MFIITLKNGAVISKSSTISTSVNGFTINDDENISYGFAVETHEVDSVPEDFVPYKYNYIDGKFVQDANYVEPVEPVSIETELEKALQKIAELENAICELTVMAEEEK